MSSNLEVFRFRRFAGDAMKRLRSDRTQAATDKGSQTPIESAPPFAADLLAYAANGCNAVAGRNFDESARQQFVRECEVEGLAKGDRPP